ncbi:MAG: FtsW/RodA/SpoVE family cell cycle protein [Bacteroidales bacterium]|nr:FtsW/RodA/SpoVE family cell cycle protein [Bacteroidales bacterium]
MKRKTNILAGDTALWVIFILLSGISLIAVYSTIGLSAITKMSSTPMHAFFRHVGFVALTYLVIIVMSHISFKRFSRPSLWLYIISVVLLILVIFLDDEKRWLDLPLLPSFQPSEIAKVVLLVFTARNIALNRQRLDDNATFYYLLIPIVIVTVLVAPSNLSTGILIFLSCYLLLYFGGINRRLWWRGFALLALLAGLAFVLFYFLGDKIDLFRTSTWGHRLQSWLHPNPNELTQENMARMAVARGGFFHTGIGTTIHGRLMTQAHNDFIYAIIIEETGSLVGAFIFALYAWFYFRCIRIATRCKVLFGSLAVAGIGTMIFLQAVTHMCVALGVMPVTGQTLPFISYGGTAYLFMGVGIGVIQSVAADNKRQQRLAMQESAADNPLPASSDTQQTSDSNPINPQSL